MPIRVRITNKSRIKRSSPIFLKRVAAIIGAAGLIAWSDAATTSVYSPATPARNAGANDGTVLQEIDVPGHAAGTAPLSTMISSPTSRSIVQRNSSGVGVIPISGTYQGSPNRIEARAVVMDDRAHSGASTGWQTIATMPAGGSYSGALTEVAAGGWYQIEVRAVAGDVPEEAAVVKKVGVGDIYLTAGQSNSANHGTPPYTPADDRVSVRLDASGALWRQGYDPMPIATGDGGSPWSRLGDQLAFADNIPVGFLCVGVGSTATSDWLPGSANYETRLKPAVKSFPTGGFRAILWHQGESDSIANVPAATYASRMAAIIAATRSDSGWAVPWYVAEASFHP
ncbi:MAG: hypothetical protein JWO82_2170, partial [Akkermansiaceae bacterium]|nr:hypothetical protein [Akkermansiaceae bacterium]